MWNYRLLKEEKVDGQHTEIRLRVIEVYYNEEGNIHGWADCADTILDIRGDNETLVYEDLKGDAEAVLDAFKLPVLIRDENDQLFEVAEKK